MDRMLRKGWVGQWKIHGHRAQVHINADPKVPLIIYTRQGGYHKKAITEPEEREWRRWFTPREGWSAFDAEWLKQENLFYVFDCLKWEGKVLSRATYEERCQYLPRDFLSPHLRVLPVLKTLDRCLEALKRTEPSYLEGLVFKSLTTPGFPDTAIVRCRKR